MRNGDIYAYTGTAIKPSISVTDEFGKTVSSSNYEISYQDNVKVGVATITVKAKDASKYTGSASIEYNILKGQISYSRVSTQAYTGEAVTPDVVITDNNRKVVPTDAYTITFKDNVEIGTATYEVTAKDGSGYFGSLTGTFEISKARITKIAVPEQHYTGKEITPVIRVYDNFGNLVDASQYDVEFDRNIDSGRAKVIVTAKDDSTYRGRLTTWFEIVPAEIARVFGSTRYETAFKTADQLKTALNVEKFSSVVITTGEQYADALSGSYLATVKDAPILLAGKDNVSDVVNYVKENLTENGTVYILGGTAAVSSVYDKQLEQYTVVRLSGASRYETNIQILKAAGVTNEEILICKATDYADSLSASAAGKPILLVGDTLTAEQTTYLKSLTGDKYYIIGGEKAVKPEVEKDLKAMGSVERVAGANRYETSVAVAKKFVANPDAVVLAYSHNFPDGLCGGPLAVSMNAPLILTQTGSETAATAYVKDNHLINGTVLGGTRLISDKAVRTIFDLDADDVIVVK